MDNSKRTKKDFASVKRLLQTCNKVGDAGLVFGVIRARLKDGITHNRHTSLVKTVCVLELLAKNGPLPVLDFIPRTIDYVERCATFYCSEVPNPDNYSPVSHFARNWSEG